MNHRRNLGLNRRLQVVQTRFLALLLVFARASRPTTSPLPAITATAAAPAPVTPPALSAWICGILLSPTGFACSRCRFSSGLRTVANLRYSFDRKTLATRLARFLFLV